MNYWSANPDGICVKHLGSDTCLERELTSDLLNISRVLHPLSVSNPVKPSTISCDLDDITRSEVGDDSSLAIVVTSNHLEVGSVVDVRKRVRVDGSLSTVPAAITVARDVQKVVVPR